MENLLFNMSECADCSESPVVKCCGKLLCDQCISSHYMHLSKFPGPITHLSIQKHRPVPLNSKPDITLTTAIHTKILNEILELEEFKTLAVQIINDFIQSIEKEVLEISQSMNQLLNEKCDELEQELKTSLSYLIVKDRSNHILELFKNCCSAEDVKAVVLVNKDLACNTFCVGSLIKESIKLSLAIQLPSEDPPRLSVQKNPFELNPLATSSAKTSSKRPHTEKSYSLDVSSFSDTEIMINPSKPPRPLSQNPQIRCQNFPKPLTPNVYNFIPFTNKIVFYSTTDKTCNELVIDSHLFPSMAAWSVTEDDKLILTGGFDEFGQRNAFMYSIYDKKVENISKMIGAKYNHAQISVGSYVYVLGGVRVGPLRECEKFNLHRREWSAFGSLIIARECPAACHYSGKIYVAGGIGIESIECSSINKPKFELLIQRLPGPGRSFMFPYDNQIYILHRSKAFTLTFPKLILNQISFISKADVWSNCEPVVSASEAHWVTNEKIFKFDIASQCISNIEWL